MADAERTTVDANVRRRMRTMATGRDTKPEVALRRELWRRGIRGYRVDRPLGLPGVRRRADIAWVGRRVAVFVDGCFWHCCPDHGTDPETNTGYWGPKLHRNVERDRETERLAADSGWTVVRAWEHEPAADVADRVLQALQHGAEVSACWTPSAGLVGCRG